MSPITKKTIGKKDAAGVEIKTRFTGLCSTCNEAMNCVQAIRATKPIVFCEMFNDTVPAQPRPQTKPAVKKPEPTTLKGLCVNCELRDTCKFPKPEGGVWHCEEYL